MALAMLADPRWSRRGRSIYRQRRIGRGGAPFDVLKLRTMVDGAEHIGAGLAVNEGDARITRVGALLRRTSLDELPNLRQRAARRHVADRPPAHDAGAGRSSTPSASAGGWRSSPGITGWAQVNGRTSLPWRERIELDLYYIEHRSLALDLRILLAHVGDGARRRRASTRAQTGRLGGRRCERRRADAGPCRCTPARASAMTSSPASRALTTTVVVDPNPLAPAQYAAHVRAAVPLIDDPALRARARAAVRRHGVGAVLPLTDLDIEVLARAARRAAAGAGARPRGRRARRTTSTRRTCCSSGWGCRRPRPCCRRGARPLLSGDGQAAPRLGRALDPSGARPRRGALLRRLRRASR